MAMLRGLEGNDSELGRATGELTEIAAATSLEDTVEEYGDLFIGITRGELLPYGSYYLTGFLNEKPLVELHQDLEGLGISRSKEAFVPEDHIATLCEIMHAMIVGRFGEVDENWARQHHSSWVAELKGKPEPSPWWRNRTHPRKRRAMIDRKFLFAGLAATLALLPAANAHAAMSKDQMSDHVAKEFGVQVLAISADDVDGKAVFIVKIMFPEEISTPPFRSIPGSSMPKTANGYPSSNICRAAKNAPAALAPMPTGSVRMRPEAMCGASFEGQLI